VDANTLTLHATAADAFNNANPISFTTGGAGVQTLDYCTILARHEVHTVIRATVNAGDYDVLWNQAPAANYYQVAVTVKHPGGNFLTAGVHASDAGTNARKRIKIADHTGTAADSAEVHVDMSAA
jgi:hypothetical protein